MARQRYCRRLAYLETPCASLPTRSPSQPRRAARKAGVPDPRKQLGERDGLSAGGNRIRTIGPAVEERPFRRPTSVSAPTARIGEIPERVRWFESGFLHRRVNCEPDFPSLAPLL